MITWVLVLSLSGPATVFDTETECILARMAAPQPAVCTRRYSL